MVGDEGFAWFAHDVGGNENVGTGGNEVDDHRQHGNGARINKQEHDAQAAEYAEGKQHAYQIRSFAQGRFA